MGWYSKIAKDISQIPNAIDYYETELLEAKKRVPCIREYRKGFCRNARVS